MPEINKTGSADTQANNQAGSPITETVPNLNGFGGIGETAGQQPAKKDENNNASGKVSEEQYKNLEKKLGEQGSELGTLREKNKEFETFFDEISPLMEKLEADKDLIGMIVEGKINSKLAKDVLTGKVSKSEAEAVTEAHKEVKKEMGKEAYENADPKEIEKNLLEKLGTMIDEKLGKTTEDVNKKLTDAEKRRESEEETKRFANNTPDLKDYVVRISELMKERPNIKRLEDLYNIAVGEHLRKERDEAIKNGDVDKAKDLALNAAGGGSHNTATVSDPSLLDRLIGGNSSPNSF